METAMWVVSTPVIGFFLITFFAGFMHKVFTFKVTMQGLPFVFCSIVIGWVFLKFTGVY